MEPGFARLPAPEIGTIANTLAFLFQHTMEWTPVGVRSLGGPGHFEQTESVTYGVSAEQGLELARTVGIEIGGEAKVPFGRVSTELSAEWSKLTRSTIRIEAQRETTTHLSYEVPAGGMDIALWRLDSRLTRRLILRPGKQLPPEPLPHWVEMAIAARPILIDIPTGITQAKTRMAETIHAVKVAEREP
jgi:hypothetical protein